MKPSHSRIKGAMILNPQIERLLGKLPDGRIAERFDVSRGAVFLWRRRLGIGAAPTGKGKR